MHVLNLIWTWEMEGFGFFPSLSWPIRPGVVCDENQTGKDMTDRIGAVYVFMILNYRDWLDRVLLLMKTR